MISKKLPCNECKGRCCTYPAFTMNELIAVKLIKGIPPGTIVKPIHQVVAYSGGNLGNGFVLYKMGGACPYFINNKCSIYEIRPKVCQDYGMREDLPCEYLYPKQSEFYNNQRLRKARTLGGP